MRTLRQVAWTLASVLLLLGAARAACVEGAPCACTSDATCLATNSTTTLVFATGGRCDALGQCRLASGFACGAALATNDSASFAFVANIFECHANNNGTANAACACRNDLASCSALDDNAHAATCSGGALEPANACPRFACVVAESTTTATATKATSAGTTGIAACHALPGCFECQERADCLYCGVEGGCLERALCTNPDPMSHVCEASFWNDTTTAVVAAVIVAGVLVLVLCVVAAITKQRDDEPVQDPFILEMRAVSENDRIALVKKDLLAAEAAEKAKIGAADANDDSALTESA